jgi:adenine phosphoribosyltransferase
MTAPVTVPPAPVTAASDASEAELLASIDAAIRAVPDFPQPGILFRDIAPLIAAPRLFAATVALLAARAARFAPTVLLAVEARGFLFGAPLALALGLPLVPVRKAGKLPGDAVGIDYGLEYGRDRLEMQRDALVPGARALLIDDLLATGGTIGAAATLARQLGAQIVGALFLIELVELGGAARLAAADVPVATLLRY